MDYNTLRNTMREWVRSKVVADPTLSTHKLAVPNEVTTQGPQDVWMRYSMQTSSDANVIGSGGPGQRASRRSGRVYLEVFGPQGDGEGLVSQLSTKLEQIFRTGSYAANAPAPEITLREPSTFERPEADRYCQVVSVPFEVDTLS